MPHIRRSRVLDKLRAGGVASCVKLNLADPRVAEIAALSGFDSIWTDREHVPNTLQQVAEQIRAAKMFDVDTIVRVPRGSYSELIWPLEMDAAGIMVPHVMSEAEAGQIAWQARFHPVGRRALDGGNADGGYCTVPVAEYMAQANDNRLVIVQIEDPEAMEALDRIANVPGIDMIFFGPGDFSQGIGHPGDMRHRLIQEARLRIADAAQRAGKFAGTVCGPGDVESLVAMGYRFLSVGADVVGLTQYFSNMVAAFGSRQSLTPTGPYASTPNRSGNP